MSEELALDLALEGRIKAASPEVGRLMALAERLAGLPDPGIDPRFAARLEARLLAEMDQALPVERPLRAVPSRTPSGTLCGTEVPTERPVKPSPVIPLPRRRVVLRKAMVAAIAAALALALPMAMVPTALPGSPLYGAKLRVEALRCALSSGASRGVCDLGRAGKRLAEVDEVMSLGQNRLVAPTIAMMGGFQVAGINEIIRSGDRGALTRAQAILTDQNDRLEALVGTASVDIRPALRRAVADGRELSGRVATALGGKRPVGKAAQPAGGTVSRQGEVKPSSDDPDSDSPVGRTDDPTRKAPYAAPRQEGNEKGSGWDSLGESAPCYAKFMAAPEGVC
ncbi:MAG: hypothetical protein HY775_09165 [Acidobacteria bacterium]|nr:hypothetical protein [Acidobacteriota bacterium]